VTGAKKTLVGEELLAQSCVFKIVHSIPSRARKQVHHASLLACLERGKMKSLLVKEALERCGDGNILVLEVCVWFSEGYMHHALLWYFRDREFGTLCTSPICQTAHDQMLD